VVPFSFFLFLHGAAEARMVISPPQGSRCKPDHL